MGVDLSGRDRSVNDHVLVKEPLRVQLDATGTPCGVAEFKEDEVVQIEDGGTGADTPEGARQNLDVFSTNEITDLIVHNIIYTDSDYESKDYEQVIVDTTGAVLPTGQYQCTIKLPNIPYQAATATTYEVQAQPADKNVVIIGDGAGNAQNRPIKVDGNGSTINGDTEFIIDVNNAEVSFKYFNGEWRAML